MKESHGCKGATHASRGLKSGMAIAKQLTQAYEWKTDFLSEKKHVQEKKN